MKKLAVLFLAAMLVLGGCKPIERQQPAEETRAGEVKLLPVVEKQPLALRQVGAGLAEAIGINSDVVGWLTLLGTEIDGPVLQAVDNEYYLRRDLEREYDVWGSYFVDYECHVESAGALDRVTIIYGHSLEDYVEAAHFSQIKKYSQAAYAEANPYIYYTTAAGESLRFEVFAAGVVNETLPYIYPNPTDETLQMLIDVFRTVSGQPFAGVEVGLGDKLLILSTCTSNEDTRYVVAAKLLDSQSNE